VNENYKDDEIAAFQVSKLVVRVYGTKSNQIYDAEGGGGVVQEQSNT